MSLRHSQSLVRSSFYCPDSVIGSLTALILKRLKLIYEEKIQEEVRRKGREESLKPWFLGGWTLRHGIIISWDSLELQRLSFIPDLQIRHAVDGAQPQAGLPGPMHSTGPKVREVELQALRVGQWGTQGAPQGGGGCGAEVELLRLRNLIGQGSREKAESGG